jgi:hypothetical protein
LRFWQSVAAVAMLFVIRVVIAARSEAAKHCLHDGRIVPRGANQLRNPGLLGISEYDIGGFLANHVDRADDKVAGDARKNRSVYNS